MTRGEHSPAARTRGKTPDRSHLFTAAAMLALAAVGLYGLHRELTATVVDLSEVAAAVLLIALCGSLGTVLILPRRTEEHRFHPVLMHTLGWSIGLAFLAFGTVLLIDPQAAVEPDDRRLSTVGGVLWVGVLMFAVGLVWVIVLAAKTIRLLRSRAAGGSTTSASRAGRVPPKRPRR